MMRDAEKTIGNLIDKQSVWQGVFRKKSTSCYFFVERRAVIAVNIN